MKPELTTVWVVNSLLTVGGTVSGAPRRERRAPRPAAEADDGTRTRYLELGKLALYQVSYIRAWVSL